MCAINLAVPCPSSVHMLWVNTVNPVLPSMAIIPRRKSCVFCGPRHAANLEGEYLLEQAVYPYVRHLRRSGERDDLPLPEPHVLEESVNPVGKSKHAVGAEILGQT